MTPEQDSKLPPGSARLLPRGMRVCNIDIRTCCRLYSARKDAKAVIVTPIGQHFCQRSGSRAWRPEVLQIQSETGASGKSFATVFGKKQKDVSKIVGGKYGVWGFDEFISGRDC